MTRIEQLIRQAPAVGDKPRPYTGGRALNSDQIVINLKSDFILFVSAFRMLAAT